MELFAATYCDTSFVPDSSGSIYNVFKDIVDIRPCTRGRCWSITSGTCSDDVHTWLQTPGHPGSFLGFISRYQVLFTPYCTTGFVFQQIMCTICIDHKHSCCADHYNSSHYPLYYINCYKFAMVAASSSNSASPRWSNVCHIISGDFNQVVGCDYNF